MFQLGNEKLNLNEIPHVLESYQQIKWTLLFIDLMYVGVIYNTDNILLSCGHDAIVFFVAFCYFAVMFNTRNHLDFYATSSICLMKNTSFPLLQNDVFHRVVMVTFGLGVYIATINISEDVEASDDSGDFGNCNFNSHYTMAFSIGFIISRSIIVFWNAVIVFFSPLPAFRQMYFYSFCSRSVIAFLTMLVMIPPLMHPESILYCMPVVIMIDLSNDHLRLGIAKLFHIQQASGVEIITPHHAHQDTIFCNPEWFLERMGLIFMLVLGEAIIGFSFTQYTSDTGAMWRSQLFAFLLLVSIAMLFYETVDRVNFDNHALVKGLNYRVVFYVLHLIAAMFLLIGIVGVIELYIDAGNVLPPGFGGTTDDSTSSHSIITDAASPSYAYSDEGHGDDGHHSIDVQWNSWLIAIGLCGMEVCLEVMRYLHEPELMRQRLILTEFKTYLRGMFRLSMALHLAIYFIADANNTASDWIIVAHAIVTLALNCLHVIIATFERPGIGSEVSGNYADAGSRDSHKSSSMLGRMSLFLSWEDKRSSLLNKSERTTELGGRKSLIANPMRSSAVSSIDRQYSRTSSASAITRKSSNDSRRAPGSSLFSATEGKDFLPPIEEEETLSRSGSMASERGTGVAHSPKGVPTSRTLHEPLL